MNAQKVLIVEDDVICREAMERLLQGYGYETCSCSSGQEAITLLKRQKFDILITDLQMPEMDGLELVSKAQSLDGQMRMVLMTGIPAEDLGDRLKKSKVNGFLSKPLDWSNLILLLESLIKVKNRSVGKF